MEILGLDHRVIHGNGARMDLLGDGEADLVLTSPPYFSEETGRRLAVPRARQTEVHDVENELFAFAGRLRPVFREIHRVLKTGRALVIQSKDIRYGDFLIPLSDQHLSVAMSCGFHLVSRFNWVPYQSHIRRRPLFLTQHRVGQFRVESGETFLILAKPSGLAARNAIEQIESDLSEMSLPLWRMSFRRRKDDHPHVSPRPVIKRLISLLTERGDLIVDPFAGYGTILAVAKSLNRAAIGWEIDADCVLEANKRLQ
jgi:DNA modification methylase